MIKKMDQSNAKKSFEKMTNLMGITKAEYLAVSAFEQFYKSRQNEGMNAIEKNQDI